ncbi:unnamed protein product [Dovyalis caffra]|uniref:Uncharacterized protein n=1 Tax=Dovyalis caffra TaxID=77055 RepID=A0AAV1S1V9_9ROSI|nr:unnamed protein product [Dovyalis caffra]
MHLHFILLSPSLAYMTWTLKLEEDYWCTHLEVNGVARRLRVTPQGSKRKPVWGFPGWIGCFKNTDNGRDVKLLVETDKDLKLRTNSSVLDCASFDAKTLIREQLHIARGFSLLA